MSRRGGGSLDSRRSLSGRSSGGGRSTGSSRRMSGGRSGGLGSGGSRSAVGELPFTVDDANVFACEVLEQTPGEVESTIRAAGAL